MPGSELETKLPTGRSRAPLVLTVDDPTVRLLAREALEEAGFEAVDAQDGESALEVVERTRPTRCCSTCTSPNLTATRSVRCCGRRRRAPIALS